MVGIVADLGVKVSFFFVFFYGSNYNKTYLCAQKT